MQSEQEKYNIVIKFCNEVVPVKFRQLAATDKNAEMFKRVLETNWDRELDFSFLEQCISQFAKSYDWLATDKPVMTHKERLALAGLSENGNPRGENVYQRKERIQREESQQKQAFESDAAHIAEIRAKAESLAQSAQVGSHSANADLRALLADTFVYDSDNQIQWFRTYEKRLEIYRKKTGGL